MWLFVLRVSNNSKYIIDIFFQFFIKYKEKPVLIENKSRHIKKSPLFRVIMDVYLYSYNCPRWYGSLTGLRNLTTNEDISQEKAIENMVDTSNTLTGSSSCSISLLLKYKLAISSVKTYPNVIQLPHSLESEITKEVVEITKEVVEITQRVVE